MCAIIFQVLLVCVKIKEIVVGEILIKSEGKSIFYIFQRNLEVNEGDSGNWYELHKLPFCEKNYLKYKMFILGPIINILGARLSK